MLGTLQIRSARFREQCVRERWSSAAEPPPAFYAVLEGRCRAELAGGSEPAHVLAAGDAVLFAHGDAHQLASLELATPALLVAAELACDGSRSQPLLAALPRALWVPAAPE